MGKNRVDFEAVRYAAGCRDAMREEFAWTISQCKARPIRTLAQFAAEEIIIPTGRFAGYRYRRDRQPAIGIYYDLLESRAWHETAVTGPTQAGKSLGAFVIPILWHLFELGETVVVGVPDKDMAADKYREDFGPVIARTRYAKLQPKRGSGSRGGKAIDAIQFANGATLKFMSGGGGDEERSHFTTRVVAITEADKLDEVGGTSREGKKLDQIRARTSHYKRSEAMVYAECTVSTEDGYIWSTYQAGTATRLLLRCPHCRKWITLERENLVGWQDADTETQAATLAAWACLECGEVITEDERIAMNQAAVPVHRGQEITPEGQVVGQPIDTTTLGYRWSAGNNLFVDAATLGVEEWKAKNAPDLQHEDHEKKLRQFRWVLPYIPPRLDRTELTIGDVVARVRGEASDQPDKKTWRRGTILTAPDAVTLNIDVGDNFCWWLAACWWRDGSGHVFDYGNIEIPRQLGDERALLVALREHRDQMIEVGWPGPNGQTLKPQLVGIDARYNSSKVYEFCRESNKLIGINRYVPTFGYGATQQTNRLYVSPVGKSQGGSIVRRVGQQWHQVYMPKEALNALHVNGDFWKTYLHARLRQSKDEPGALTLFWTPPRDQRENHTRLAKHFLSERQEEEFVPGKGLVVRWVAIHRQNHWFDTAYNATALAHFLGCSVIESKTGSMDVKVANDWWQQQNAAARRS